MHNLAGQEQYAAVEEELTKRLLNEMRRTGDPRLIREGVFYETPPMAGPLKEKSPGWKNQKRKKNILLFQKDRIGQTQFIG